MLQQIDVRKRGGLFFAAIGWLLLIIFIDIMTNRLDISKYAWDFKYYIAFAKEGFAMKDLISPVAYRYMTPFLAGGLHRIFGISVTDAFIILSYIGLWMQLMGSYLFVLYYFKSFKAAVSATLVVAFSAVNVKFLLFDPFRPDLFGYIFVLLGTYFALKKQVWALILVSAFGVQFREFALVPLVAYIAVLFVSKDWNTLKRYGLWFVAAFFISVVVPRMTIEITQSAQYIQKLEHLWLIPMDWKRDFNWLYTILVYFLPVFLLITPSRVKKLLKHIPDMHKRYIVFYTLLVALLSMYGGTDLARFSTYFFMTQIIIVGCFALYASKAELIYMTVAVFWFNKIHTPIPVWDFNLYLNWYCGYANIITEGTFRHLYTEAALIIGAVALRLIERYVVALKKPKK
jgi:hypothetical protein